MNTTMLSPSIESQPKYYTLDDFSKMLFGAVSYKLSPEVLATISYLESVIEIPEFSPPLASNTVVSNGRSVGGGGFKTDYRPSKHGGGGGGPSKHTMNNTSSRRHEKGGNQQPTSEDWELMRSFKTTKMEVKVGVEKNINDIRIVLNKMSTANYAKQSAIVLEQVQQYMEHADTSAENMDKIATAIFSIASSNKFYSELYAELYRELVAKFDIFRSILDTFVAGFVDTIQTIEYVDPDVNYDEFCRINKANDNRKATTTFIINLMKKGLVSRADVARILGVFVNTVLEYITEEGRIHAIEEITENVFLFVSNCHAELKTTDEWSNTVAPTVKRLSTAKPADHKSMSNRVMFKYMDMVAHV